MNLKSKSISSNLRRHIIICEWNYRAKLIYQELRNNFKRRQVPIVVIADIEDEPIKNDNNLFFIKGAVEEETLREANIKRAKTVVILGDENLDDTSRDAKVALSTLTVENTYRQVYTIVELADERYFELCQKAHADRIIVAGSNFRSHLVSRAIINNGISDLVSYILTEQSKNQFYQIPVSSFYEGCSFVNVLVQMRRYHQGTIIAIFEASSGKLVTNPKSDYELQKEDYLIVMTRNKSYFSRLCI
ncbi:K+ transport system, NAD-binding component [Rivularia sp. PCC 7116]|uniref:TrkA-related ion transporter n=1 Tax=Rivularia sp. PCC 7116 TaxID=373994 RepID=UPI00029ED300|nr:NAD-binding protein [Rivularia sp. PCC 7116]AFY56250.1 K+ transport system, NAD-binding component [Rivularia sp. PCC 7116]